MINTNYVDHLDFFGVRVKEISCTKFEGAPTESTVGAVGLLGMDTLTGDVWKCVSVSNNIYKWKYITNECKFEQLGFETVDIVGPDVTYTFLDDYYVIGSNGAATPNSSLGLSVANVRIESGKRYIMTAWDNPNTQVNCVGFYSFATSSCTGIDGYLGKDFTKTVAFDVISEATRNTNGIYAFTAPETAVMIRYTYFKADESYCKENATAYKLPWLIIETDNLSADVKNIMNKTSADISVRSVLDKPLNFNGKSCVAFGDSITFGITSPSLEYTYAPYIKTFADKASMNLTNQAVSGTCITDASDADNSIYKKIIAYTTDTDVIIIAGGVNDYTTGKPLGEYNSTDITTFYGAMRGICDSLTANHTDATVIFITPINCTHNAPDAVADISEYRNAIFEIAAEYGFNVVDGSQLGFPSKTGGFQEFMMTDGCHPTQAGHDFYAKNLYNVLMG